MKRILSKKKIEELVKEKYINLNWFCPPDCMKKTNRSYHSYGTEKTKFVLYGLPKDYNGACGDHLEPLFAQVVDKDRMKTRGYRRIKGIFGGILIVGKWSMES